MSGADRDGMWPRGRQRELNLKWALVRRIILVAVICAAAPIGFVMVEVGAEARRQDAEIAGAVHKQLLLQLLRIDRGTDLASRFPDWESVTRHMLRTGQCVRLEQREPARTYSNCVGIDAGGRLAPGWFAEAYKLLVTNRSAATEAIVHRGVEIGTLEASTDIDTVIDQAWNRTSSALLTSVLMTVLLCLSVYAIVGHALKPTGRILLGIDRLAAGELSHRLSRFRLSELQRIADGLNHLAERLETTTRDRAELARKLIDARERERGALARELHDDVAQRLTALTLLARSIVDGVGPGSEGVSADAAKLAEMTAQTMRSLRQTLIFLRPPEIDDLGLHASLRELIAGSGRQAGGTIRFTFRADGPIDTLPGEAAAHIYRIVQEGLTNALRHAEARNVGVTLKVVDAGPLVEIELTIADDGQGAPEAAMLRPRAGLGLIGIRERVYALGGEMRTETGSANGFRLLVRFAIESQPKARS